MMCSDTILGPSICRLRCALRIQTHDCLKCHAGSVKWIASHEDYKDALFSGEATCMQCHADSNPAHTIAQNVKP